jgi:hypothetical protein
MPLAAAEPVSLSGPPRHAVHDMVLPVPFVSQRPYQNLSWAACGAMVLQYSNVNKSLSKIVSDTLGPDCTPTTCDKPFWPENMYKAYGFACQIIESPLTLQSVKAWIANTQPVQAYFLWRDGEGSHTVLIVGCNADDDWLMVYDPLYGISWQSYQTVLFASGRGGTWQRTWYNIRNDSNVPLS